VRVSRHSSNEFACTSHKEDAAAVPLRRERDAFAIRRESRFAVVALEILRKVDRVAPAGALQVDVAVAGCATLIEEPFAVGRQARQRFYTLLIRQARERRLDST